MVDLVLLHGPPAAGKLTTANALSALVKARVFHNHLTLDVAKSLLNFGDPEFWDLVHDLRLLSLTAYFKYGTNTAIATWCYEESIDFKKYCDMKSIATASNGRILPIYLYCELHYLEDRVTHMHRREMNKLCELEQLRNYMSTKKYTAIPDDLCLEIDSGMNSAEHNAQEIVRKFDL